MSESPRSEKCETWYSTPMPELDDHRFHMDGLPREDSRAEIAAGGTAAAAANQTSLQSPQSEFSPRQHLHVSEALRDAGTIARDFEQAVVDDDGSVRGIERTPTARKMSGRPTVVWPNTVKPGGSQDPPQIVRSRSSSTSSRSLSPPNSVEAFAEPRRRERANTVSSIASDIEGTIQRTLSMGTHQRRPTFSNASAIRPETLDPRTTANLPEQPDMCFPAYEEPGQMPIIDYEALEEFVAIQKRAQPSAVSGRKYSLCAPAKPTRVFHDVRTQPPKIDVPRIVMHAATTSDGYSTDFLDQSSQEMDNFTEKAVIEENEHDKARFEKLHNLNEPSKFSFFSSEAETTIHATELGDLILPGDSFRDLFELGPDGGVWWLDVLNPTEDELKAVSRAFCIHPLTVEDIMMQESREKVELFKQYYFVCFRTFYQVDQSSENFLEPINFYMVVFREGVLSFSFIDNPHAGNVRKRIGKLRDYVSLSSDWICYAMIDDIVDSFGPIIREVEKESEAIEDHVFIARVEDYNEFLPRIGNLRKKVMSLMRLLGGKADVIKGFAKRCNEQYSVTPRGDIGLYLGDIQDHVVTMMSNLGHFEKMLSRSHTNYLTQINVTNIMLGNQVNKVLSKITFLATVLVPMNLVCGLFGMNVTVPGENTGSLNWFFGIVGVIGFIMILSIIAARRFRLI